MPLDRKVYTNDGIASDCFELVPDDTANAGLLTVEADRVTAIRGLYCEAAGVVKFETDRGKIRIVPVPAGFLIECAIVRVFATGTTAIGPFLGFE